MSYKKGFISLLSYAFVGQLLSFAAYPLLTRLYSPTSFAIYGLFFSLTTIFGSIAGLCYETAMVAMKRTIDAQVILVWVLLLMLLSSLGYTCFFVLIIHFNLFNYGSLSLVPYWCFFLMIFSVSSYQAFKYYLLRFREYTFISQSTMTKNLTRVVLQILLGVEGSGTGIILGEIFSRFLSSLHLFLRIKDFKRVLNVGSIKRFKLVAKRNIRYPLFLMPSTFINITALSIPIPLIMYYFGATYAGIYMLVNRLLSVPLVLITQNIADVFHSHIAELCRTNSKTIKKVFLKYLSSLFLAAIVPAIIAGVISPYVFGFLFGKEWALAGYLLPIILPWVVSQFVISPLSRVVFVMGGQQSKLIYDVMAVIAIWGGFVIGHHLKFDFLHTLLLVSINMTISYLMYLCILYDIIRVKAMSQMSNNLLSGA